MDRKFHTLSIRFFGDFVRDFQFKNGIFKRVGVDKNNSSVDAKTAGRKTCKRHENAIKVACTIIVEVCVWNLGQLRMIKTKFLDEGESGRIPAGASPVLAVVDSVGVDRTAWYIASIHFRPRMKLRSASYK